MKDIPEGCRKLIITRFPPKKLDISKYPHTHIIKSLSPSKELLLDYKKNNNWELYVERFHKEMIQIQDMKRMLHKLKLTLEADKNVCLICYEKDYTKCHRGLIGEYFKKQGFEWKEL